MTRGSASQNVQRDGAVMPLVAEMNGYRVGREKEATTTGVKIVGPEEGAEGFLGSVGVRFMIDGSEAGERFSLVEHPMSPRALAAPLHLHTRGDE